MLALAAVVLGGSCPGSSIVISPVQTFELLHFALPAYLLALVLLTLPFCRTLQQARHTTDSTSMILVIAGWLDGTHLLCTQFYCTASSVAHLWIQNLFSHTLSLSFLSH